MAYAPRSQNATAVERQCITQLRSELGSHIALFNTELVDDVTLVAFEDMAMQVRDEQGLDEKALPQNVGGVRVRIIESTDVPSVSIGECRTRHVLEVRTAVNCQDNEADTTLTSASGGAVRIGYLAEVVDDVLRRRMIGKVGIYNFRLMRGHVPQRTPDSMPSVKEKLWTYEVWQRTRRPIIGETLPAYGGWYLTTEASTQTVVADTDEAVDVATTATAGFRGVAHTSPATLTITDAGVYELWVTATAAHDVNRTDIHISFAIDGVEATQTRQSRHVGTGGDVGNQTTSSLLSLSAGAVVTVLVEGGNSGDVTWEHLSMLAQRV